MHASVYDIDGLDIAWCPGCGNFKVLDSVKQALSGLDIGPDEVVMVSGIGQAAKLPQYMRCNYFNGLHGRSLPVATAIKAVNPQLTVIAESGDGCTYGEGGNHFIHTVRRNTDLTHIVHDNMVYGLTKGQASPTSQPGFKTSVQTEGVILEPFNPMAVAISLNATFVARAFAGDVELTSAILQRAIKHKGYALVDVLQPCVTFNRQNSFRWFKEHTEYLVEEYDSGDRQKAFAAACDSKKLHLGVLYERKDIPSFESRLPVYQEWDVPLIKRRFEPERVEDLIMSKV